MHTYINIRKCMYVDTCICMYTVCVRSPCHLASPTGAFTVSTTWRWLTARKRVTIFRWTLKFRVSIPPVNKKIKLNQVYIDSNCELHRIPSVSYIWYQLWATQDTFCELHKIRSVGYTGYHMWATQDTICELYKIPLVSYTGYHLWAIH